MLYTITSDPPLFYQRSYKARLKVHPEQRVPSFTSLSPKRVSMYNCNETDRKSIYVLLGVFVAFRCHFSSHLCGSYTMNKFCGWLEQTRRLQHHSILFLNCHPIYPPAGGSVKWDITLAGDFLSSRAGRAAAVPHCPPIHRLEWGLVLQYTASLSGDRGKSCGFRPPPTSHLCVRQASTTSVITADTGTFPGHQIRSRWGD